MLGSNSTGVVFHQQSQIIPGLHILSSIKGWHISPEVYFLLSIGHVQGFVGVQSIITIGPGEQYSPIPRLESNGVKCAYFTIAGDTKIKIITPTNKYKA